MQTRQLENGPAVSALGLGCMGLSGMYGKADERESLETIETALDTGINLLDTGDFYGMGHNEMLLAKALQGKAREKAVLSVKFGAMRSPNGEFIGIDNRPQAVKNALAYTLKRLNTDYVDIYRPARLDPTVPIEETIGAISELVQAGYVKHVGLSEVSAETIRRAHAVHPISDLQIEYSVFTRDIEAEILPVLRELQIGLTAYGVLSRGLISSTPASVDSNAANDFRAHLPRFSEENLAHNYKLVEALQHIALEKGITVAQLAIAWVLAQGGNVIPLVGTRKAGRLKEAVGALNVSLSAGDLERIEQAVPKGAVAGSRYNKQQMALLDSEKPVRP